MKPKTAFRHAAHRVRMLTKTFAIASVTFFAAAAFAQPEPHIQALMNRVSQQNLNNYVRALAEADGHRTRATFTEGNRWAVSYLKQTFESFAGLSAVALDTFLITSAPPPLNAEKLFNVVATLTGREEPEKIYLIGGHLDCTANRDPGVNWQADWQTTAAPGADDNASGVAAILEAARILSDPASGFASKYTLMFAAFNSEELHPAYASNHLGSFNFVKKAFAEQWDLQGAYIVDMIGYNSLAGDYFAIASNRESQALGEKLLEVNSTYGLGLNAPGPPFPAATYSDHDRFWIYRYQAVLIIENTPPWENSPPWYTSNPFYHTRSDTAGTINLAQVEKITQMVIGAVASLSGTATAVAEGASDLPAGFTLLSNHPNPFANSTRIHYFLPAPGRVSLKIFDLLGQEIVTLVQTHQPAGEHVIPWNVGALHDRRLKRGIYFYVLQAGGQRRTGKMVFMP